MGRYPCPGRGKRVAEGYRATSGIELFARDPQLALDGAGLGRKSLVDLYEIHVVEREAGTRQGDLRCRNRPDPHHCRVDSGDAPRYETAERLQRTLRHEFLAGDDHRTCAIADSRCISGGYDTRLTEYRLEAA